jgi:hypothetical protein
VRFDEGAIDPLRSRVRIFPFSGFRPLLVCVVLALVPGAALSARADPLAELRKAFTVDGKPVPPEVFADFGDAMLSDSRPIVVTVDAKSAIDGNRYADPIAVKGRWVEQAKPGSGSFNGAETTGYEFIGATANGLLVAVATWSGGGSGTFTFLHVLDAALSSAFDDDGKIYQRVDLTILRTVSLGDR